MSNSEAKIPLVAIYGLYKNDEKNVERFLQSVKEADEIVLCDIGSTDCTNMFIQQFKKRHPDVNVSTFTICVSPYRIDDARNTALSLVNPEMDLCISMDLNEYLMENWKRYLLSQWEYELTRYQHVYQAKGVQKKVGNRIHQRLGYTWKLPIYEILEFNGEEIKKDLPQFIIYQENNSEINPNTILSLLEKSVKERKDLWMSWGHLATEYVNVERYEEAHKVIETALSIENSDKSYLYEIKYQIFKGQNKVNEAISNLHLSILNCSSDPTFLYCELASYLKQLGRNLEAYLTIKEAETASLYDEALQELAHELCLTLREDGVIL